MAATAADVVSVRAAAFVFVVVLAGWLYLHVESAGKMSASSLEDVIAKLGIEETRDELYNFAINGELIIHGEKKVKLDDGDEVEIVVAFSGG